MATGNLISVQQLSEKAKTNLTTEFLAAVEESAGGSVNTYEIPDVEENDHMVLLPAPKPTLILSEESTEAEHFGEQLIDIENCIDEVRSSQNPTFLQKQESTELQQTIEKIVCARLIDLENRLEEVRPSPKPTLFLSRGSTELEQAIENIVCSRLTGLEKRMEHLHTLHLNKAEALHMELVELLRGRMGGLTTTAIQPAEFPQKTNMLLEDSDVVLVGAGDCAKQDLKADLTRIEAKHNAKRHRKPQPARGDSGNTLGRGWSKASLASLASGDVSLRRAESNEFQLDQQISFVNDIHKRSKLWRLLEDPNSSKMAKLYSKILPMYIIITVIWSLLELISPLHVSDLEPSTKDALQISFEALFMLDLSLRFLTCPHPLVFWTHFCNILEPLSCVVLVLRTVVRDGFGSENEMILALSCIVPVLRSMKLIRHFEHFRLLFSAFRSAAEALPVLLFTLLLIALTFSGIVFYVERDMAPTYLDALFFTIVTMSTVGFGNQVPETQLGMGIVGALIIISGLYVAIPIGIVGNAFSLVWAERGRLTILDRLRRFIVRAGFTFSDLQSLFQMCDQDSDGTLTVHEFATMMEVMRIGMERERFIDIFETFDYDGDGAIDYEEFLKVLFPRAYQIALRASFFSSSNSAHLGLSVETEDAAVCLESGETVEDESQEAIAEKRRSIRSLESLRSVCSEMLDKKIGPLRN